jgi:hypothetical protein
VNTPNWPTTAWLLAACSLPAVAVHAAAAQAAQAAPQAPPGAATDAGSDRRLTAASLDASLALGRQYLLNAQRPDGSFVYEVDAVRGTALPGRHIVREMGGVWGIALFHRHDPGPATAEAFARAMRLQDTFAKQARAGGRYLCEPASREGATNAIAIYALALQDFLAADHPLDPKLRAKYERDLAATVKFLLSLRRPDGFFHSGYDCADGRGLGAPEPYADGEVLLVLVRAFKDAKDPAQRKLVTDSAAAMYVRYVRTAIQVNPANEETKGFYQWGSMAFYHLYRTAWPGTAAYAPRTIAMARWMTDVHDVLSKPRNTGYAFEGLAVAWDLARLTGDDRNQRRIAAAIDAGMSKLLSWQVGSPLAGAAIPDTFRVTPRTKGGILTEPDDPRLRIDTVQHQMHAALLVRQLLFGPTDNEAADADDGR